MAIQIIRPLGLRCTRASGIVGGMLGRWYW